ncbi:aminoglycoside phosphotransferase family protein [Arthrobacter sp. NEB 688]|uniref:aminoglycoside phosphotransferase family protein n=1 Tax=Arthrobacter sp. NEB 688 TaxID=904039 RepID=UPI001563430C|nr:aminoglycoside phosphotransferase family protein [Arthrobacter sp. NEB 688]QKE84307.1 phosphotransferase [Arthrobacter sp. NEB 688]
MSDVDLPPEWAARVATYPADGGPTGADWLAQVPHLVARALERWDLVLDDGPAGTGWTALLLPVRRGGERLALKVGWPHPEGAHEHLALRTWAGAGAVRLVAALPSDGLLLLERLERTDLTDTWDEEACAVVGGLLRRLHVAAPPQVPRIGPYLEPHLERMAARPAVPRRLATRTLGLARELLPDAPELLLHTDLHYENVLHHPSGGWTAIDPKPVAGHPGFDLWPVLRNRFEEMGTGSAFRWSVRRRLEVTAEAAGVDPDEARAWTLLRAGVEVSWASALEGEEAVTACIALHKALDE